ncbi:ubiquitin thioesterase OTU1-like isoform X1 [Camellia sinensis]|uniref:ubiquitin thioesterase OTU1-like isoform X1 n=1 Tax=Camellia sinensis TaxID=4442 RepID=UPI001035C7E9|nr:ubiquitin thioesterase OTU1-like isoform X1 [Camellia sinensis]
MRHFEHPIFSEKIKQKKVSNCDYYLSQIHPRVLVLFPHLWMEGTIVRRVIPSDNSCLFNAVGYVMDHDKHKAPQLRQVIAATVASDPTQYSEAFLGKPNEEYRAWILNPEKWGGAIELAILADYYGREIAAYDIQTTRCDLYGQQGKNYHERVMLIYDGIHYDALAISFYNGAPEEFDQTIFTVQKDRTIGPIERLALNLAKEQQRKRSYTDTANFTLRCEVCQIGVVGQKGAMKHAQATGHVNFQEFR